MAELREIEIEGPACDYAELRGWFVCKFVSPGKNAVPDRLFIRNGRHVFIEFKRPDEEPSKQQYKRHRDMRKYGAEVYWTDNLEDAKRILK